MSYHLQEERYVIHKDIRYGCFRKNIETKLEFYNTIENRRSMGEDCRQGRKSDGAVSKNFVDRWRVEIIALNKPTLHRYWEGMNICQIRSAPS